ncbi:MAG: Yop proteins translocation protein K [Polaromonas sp.]|nr:Yop proteins translocation protein K [Polaromonas sp.]
MLAVFPSSAWRDSALAEPLLRFACLPSVALHPSRVADLVPPTVHALLAQVTPDMPYWGRLHRHWSAALVQSLGLAPLSDVTDPALALALLPPPVWNQVQMLGAALLAGPRIRRTIARSQVQALQSQLGAPVLAFARGPATALHAGWDAALALDFDQLLPVSLAWGEALQARALEAATPAVAQRGRLRLPAAAIDMASSAQFSSIDPSQALALVRSLTEMTDPAWLSSFHAIH